MAGGTRFLASRIRDLLCHQSYIWCSHWQKQRMQPEVWESADSNPNPNLNLCFRCLERVREGEVRRSGVQGCGNARVVI
jgi:hypothetical protein